MEPKGKKLVSLIFGLIGSSLLIITAFIAPITPSPNNRTILVGFIGIGVLGLIGAILSFIGKRALGGGLMIAMGIFGLMWVGVTALFERMIPPYDTDPLYLIALIYPLFILLGGILGPKKTEKKY